jgi:hypothetical protein
MNVMSIKDLFSWHEIQKDFALRVLGAGLALTHVWTYFFWNGAGSLSRYLDGPVRICWSFYQACEKSNFFGLDQLDAYFLFYLLIALGAAVLFLFKKTVVVACWLLIILTVLKSLVIIQDYRFMGNYHYMPFWMTAAYLMMPAKKSVCAILLALFYFGAGLLKLNPEWLSGAAMIRPPWIEGKLLEWAVAFVVFLELYFVFWIFASKLWRRASAVTLLILFHAFSWHIVGFFYPMVMYSMLAFLLIALPRGIEINWRSINPYFLPGLFMAFQLVPLVFFRESALTGEGRILSLNMFDAKAVCSSEILLKKPSDNQNAIEIVELPPLIENFGVRIACDPLVHLAQAKSYCDLLEDVASGDNPPVIDVSLASKATVEASSRMILEAKDVCRNPPKVSWWGAIQ